MTRRTLLQLPAYVLCAMTPLRRPESQRFGPDIATMLGSAGRSVREALNVLRTEKRRQTFEQRIRNSF